MIIMERGFNDTFSKHIHLRLITIYEKLNIRRNYITVIHSSIIVEAENDVSVCIYVIYI